MVDYIGVQNPKLPTILKQNKINLTLFKKRCLKKCVRVINQESHNFFEQYWENRSWEVYYPHLCTGDFEKGQNRPWAVFPKLPSKSCDY